MKSNHKFFKSILSIITIFLFSSCSDNAFISQVQNSSNDGPKTVYEKRFNLDSLQVMFLIYDAHIQDVKLGYIDELGKFHPCPTHIFKIKGSRCIALGQDIINKNWFQENKLGLLIKTNTNVQVIKNIDKIYLSGGIYEIKFDDHAFFRIFCMVLLAIIVIPLIFSIIACIIETHKAKRKERKPINASILFKKFPNYKFWNNCQEIVGTDGENLVVIEDGLCSSGCGWVVHKYNNLSKDIPLEKMKYGCGDKILEKRMELS